MMPKTYDDGFIKVYESPNGPIVYAGNDRVHHWLPGILMAGFGFLGLILDESEQRDRWGSLAFLGILCVLSDLPDLIQFLASRQ